MTAILGSLIGLGLWCSGYYRLGEVAIEFVLICFLFWAHGLSAQKAKGIYLRFTVFWFLLELIARPFKLLLSGKARNVAAVFFRKRLLALLAILVASMLLGLVMCFGWTYWIQGQPLGRTLHRESLEVVLDLVVIGPLLLIIWSSFRDEGEQEGWYDVVNQMAAAFDMISAIRSGEFVEEGEYYMDLEDQHERFDEQQVSLDSLCGHGIAVFLVGLGVSYLASLHELDALSDWVGRHVVEGWLGLKFNS